MNSETPAERRFKQAVRDLLAEGVYPAPKALLLKLGFVHRASRSGVGGPNLNGRESQWRREEMIAQGWVAAQPFHWVKPLHAFVGPVR